MIGAGLAAAQQANGQQEGRPVAPTRAAPGLPGRRYKDVDGTILLKTNNGMFIRAMKLGPNRWLSVVIRDGVVVMEAMLGHKDQAEMCRRIDNLLADEAA